MWRSLKGSGYLGCCRGQRWYGSGLALVLLAVNRILGATVAPIASAGRPWRPMVFHGRVVARRLFNVSPCEWECGAFPLAWAWPKKTQERNLQRGDSRHFCRHAAGQVLRGLSPVSPVSPAGRMWLSTPIRSPRTQVSASPGFCLGGDVAYFAQAFISSLRLSKKSDREYALSVSPRSS
ncbi:hypothetical protein PS903_06055 [Pseudomonas fluorescens]|nr:hypothetical protein PS903_06055 [Pseudomonas fluorescens]